MHEAPSSHVHIEHFNPDPIPGERRWTVDGPTPHDSHEYVQRPEIGPITIYNASEKGRVPQITTHDGQQYQANIDGRSIHPIQIQETDGTTFATIVTDQREQFTVPLDGSTNDTPVRSIASKTVHGDQVHTTLLFFDPKTVG